MLLQSGRGDIHIKKNTFSAKAFLEILISAHLLQYVLRSPPHLLCFLHFLQTPAGLWRLWRWRQLPLAAVRAYPCKLAVLSVLHQALRRLSGTETLLADHQTRYHPGCGKFGEKNREREHIQNEATVGATLAQQVARQSPRMKQL